MLETVTLDLGNNRRARNGISYSFKKLQKIEIYSLKLGFFRSIFLLSCILKLTDSKDEDLQEIGPKKDASVVVVTKWTPSRE